MAHVGEIQRESDRKRSGERQAVAPKNRFVEEAAAWKRE